MLPFFLILAVAALVLTPYALMIFKRAKMLKRIRIKAEKSGFKVKELHKLVLLSSNKSDKYDLLFVGEKRAYAVKLWSTLHSDSTLVACSDKSFYVSRRVSEPFTQSSRGDYNFREPKSKLPETKLSVKLKGGREIIPVLLIYPRYKAIMRKKGNDVLVFEQGDTLFGKKMYYPEGFERLILKDSKSASETAVSARSKMSMESKNSKKSKK